MSDEDYDDQSEQMECSYCGKSIYADVIRCPKCGNYTDGKGPLAAEGSRPRSQGGEGRPIPRIFVIAGWLVIIGLLLPVLIAVIHWATK